MHASTHSWHEKLIIALIWVALAWIVWDFIHWIDPAYRIDPATNPPRLSPRGLTADPTP